MASVFLSYDRDDTHRARPLAAALEKVGHKVWWDLHVRGGAQFSKVIEEALKAADVVVVLWSANSIESAWVRDEAAAGRDSGRLIPVTIDGTEAPMGFRQFQMIDLSRWRGRGRPRELRALLSDVEAMSPTGQLGARTTTAASSTSPKGVSRHLTGAFTALTLLLIGTTIFVWLDQPKEIGVQSVAVVAADASAKQFARELLANLGNLQFAKGGAVRLLGENGPTRPAADLIFEAGGDPQPGHASASLLLMAGKDNSVLWSKDFKQDSGNIADLKQQMAFTAARILGCALDTRNPDGRGLGQQSLKAYLNACADLAEIGAVDSSPVIPSLLQLTREAPQFHGAWAKLLLAESQVVGDERSLNDPAHRLLQQHINAARKVDADMAEIAVAEAAFLGNGYLVKRGRILDQTASAHPDDANVLGARSSFLAEVGRMRESIGDARRAVEVDPLSPLRRNEYISSLMYGGRIDAAREQLNTANRLWPGTVTFGDIQFRFHLRYGDPKVAADLLPSTGGPGLELYLRARIDPTPENVNRLTSYVPPRNADSPAFLSNRIQARGEFNRKDDLFALFMQPGNRSYIEFLTAVFFRPGLKSFRQDPRFMQVAKLAGLLEYWRTTGNWPDFCFDDDLPYDCKKEAARFAER